MSWRLWAPAAKRAELKLGGRSFPLRPGPKGIWASGPEAPPPLDGAAYRFSVDGRPARPDPRSRWQPDGVHGDSRWVDLARLRPEAAPPFKPAPLSQAIIYELHVGTFTPEGTYRSAQARLPHLAKLGVTHVELMPVASFPGDRGWGYDGVDLYAPHPAYGTPADLAALVDACHRHGLAVLLDVVYNHFGPDGNYAPEFGPYFTDRYKTAWGSALNFDGPGSDGVRDFVIENALMWLRDYGFDGLRLDAVHAIDCFGAVHVLEQLASAVRRFAGEAGRRVVLMAESDLNDPRLVRSVARGGYGLDAHWEDDFHHALHAFFTGERDGYYADFGRLEDLALALREGYVLQGTYSVFRQRHHGRPPVGIAPPQLVVCSQNHDQVGNRPQGDRLSALVGRDQLKAVAALTLLSPFTPLLFQGEEWGARTPFLYFTDHRDAALARAVTEGRRREHHGRGWQGEVPDPQAPESFQRSKLQWAELKEPGHADLLQWHRDLIALRRRNRLRALETAAEVRCDPAALWLRLETGDVAALFNFWDRPQMLPMPEGAWEVILDSGGAVDSPHGPLPAHGTRILVRQG